MSLKEKINEDIKSALKAGDSERVSVLRMLSASIKNREIQLLKKDVGLSDTEIIEVIRAEAKKRRDSAVEFEKANRPELKEKEEKEAEILKAYLPAELSDVEIQRILQDGIRETGAKDEKDFGKVMKAVMPALKGRASGDRISAALKNLLLQ